MSSVPVRPQDWQPPPELDQPLPRRVTPRYNPRIMHYTIFGFSLPILALISILAIKLHNNIQLITHGTLTTAQAINSEFNPRRYHSDYDVTYVFQAPNHTKLYPKIQLAYFKIKI